MAHIHDKIDFTVEVFIVHGETVLLRKHDKYGIWLSVGGHIELDEDPNEAALREAQEEVGLDVALYDTREYFGDDSVQELIAPVSVNRHRISETHEHVTLVYFATADTDTITPEKTGDEWKWCSADDLDSMDLQGNVAFYARKALELLRE